MGRVPAIVCRAGSQDQEISPNASVSISCSIDDPSSCSIADLEMLYIDALWNFYNGGSFTLTDEQYDRLREELNWQGEKSFWFIHGFSTCFAVPIFAVSL